MLIIMLPDIHPFNLSIVQRMTSSQTVIFDPKPPINVYDTALNSSSHLKKVISYEDYSILIHNSTPIMTNVAPPLRLSRCFICTLSFAKETLLTMQEPFQTIQEATSGVMI